MRECTRWLKPLVFTACLLPAVWVGYRALGGTLGVNPVESLHHHFGDWTLRFLLLTLLITPLRLLPGWSGLGRLRRMLGLFAFFYATLHVGVYIGLDQQFDWPAILADITERPYITLGASAYLLMIPLALTSRAALMQRMGRWWSRFHRLIYLVTALGILHLFLLVKVVTWEPWLYAALFGVLLVLRVVLAGKRVVNKPRPRGSGAAGRGRQSGRHATSKSTW